MLRVSSEQINLGVRITLPESWHEKILCCGKIFGKMQGCPYTFVIAEIAKQDKETYYICEAEKKERGKKVRIVLTEYVTKYILGREVPDSNIGFSFQEYLPIENSKLLITNVKNPNEIISGILQVECEFPEIHGERMIALTFKIEYIDGMGIADIRDYLEGSKKSTWKFALHEDESYMTDYEKMYRDTIVHKEYVEQSINKLAQYLEKEGAVEHARLLRKRGQCHDNSKISCADEVEALSRIINDKSCLKDADKQLSPIKKEAIALHWKHNTHHPEHFKSVLDMSKLDIMEMCCDWHARSTQYKTDFLDFVKKHQENRFHFPDWMFQEIWHYCRVLDSEL